MRPKQCQSLHRWVATSSTSSALITNQAHVGLMKQVHKTKPTFDENVGQVSFLFFKPSPTEPRKKIAEDMKIYKLSAGDRSRLQVHLRTSTLLYRSTLPPWHGAGRSMYGSCLGWLLVLGVAKEKKILK